MRYLLACIALLITIFSGCSTTQTAQEDRVEKEPVVEEDAVPDWYRGGVHFSSDSLALYGYSLASATDSLEAVQFSTETALSYLRSQVDRELEEIRENFADSEGDNSIYNSPAFIIRLRNTVSELPLESASLTQEHETSDNGVHYMYTKATLSRKDLNNLLRRNLEDERFLEQINQAFM